MLTALSGSQLPLVRESWLSRVKLQTRAFQARSWTRSSARKPVQSRQAAQTADTVASEPAVTAKRRTNGRYRPPPDTMFSNAALAEQGDSTNSLFVTYPYSLKFIPEYHRAYLPVRNLPSNSDQALQIHHLVLMNKSLPSCQHLLITPKLG